MIRKRNASSRFSRIAREWLLFFGGLPLPIIDIRIRESSFTQFRHDGTNETDERNANKGRDDYSVARSNLGPRSNRVGPRARNSERRKNGRKGRGTGGGWRVAAAPTGIGPRNDCDIDVSNRIPRIPADENGIDVYFDDWKSPAIGAGAPGCPNGPLEPFALSRRFSTWRDVPRRGQNRFSFPFKDRD